MPRSMRRVFEQVILSILFPARDRFHLGVDGDHRVAKTVQLVFWFALSRLDHHCSSRGERNRGGVKSVIHQALCHVFDFDAGAFALAQIDDALVRDEAVLTLEEHWKVWIEPLGDVIRV